jgi:PadR family transcriptional regulator, regulatory protein PadR
MTGVTSNNGFLITFPGNQGGGECIRSKCGAALLRQTALSKRLILFDDQYCEVHSTDVEDDGQGRKFQNDLNTGLVALVLLAVLERSPEDLYGYEIAKRLQRANEGDALFKEGTIYPVLRTLSASGLLTSRIVPSYSGPPRRYYRITDEGRAVLRQWSGIWRQTRDFVDRFIEGKAS